MKHIFALIFSLLFTYSVFACTRVMYKGPNNTFITARSMDWLEDLKTNVWVFPRGINRDGATDGNTVKWKSKYGSVGSAAFDITITDGMNEKGLVANMLWLAETKYPKYDASKPGLAVSVWAQYILDNFATVNEAVTDVESGKYSILAVETPGSAMSGLATLHLSLSDATGDNAIIEFIDGKLVVHHDAKYQVMTNSPTFEKQLALNEYWQQIGGTTMLPGTNRAADRFARASFYVTAITQTDNTQVALAAMFGVIRNCSVPLGITTPGQPNIASTIWRTVSDHKNKVYYFEGVLSPNIFWLDLKTLDLSEKASIKKLSLTNNEIYAGEASKQLKPSTDMVFKRAK